MSMSFRRAPPKREARKTTKRTGPQVGEEVVLPAFKFHGAKAIIKKKTPSGYVLEVTQGNSVRRISVTERAFRKLFWANIGPVKKSSPSPAKLALLRKKEEHLSMLIKQKATGRRIDDLKFRIFNLKLELGLLRDESDYT